MGVDYQVLDVLYDNEEIYFVAALCMGLCYAAHDPWVTLTWTQDRHGCHTARTLRDVPPHWMAL